MHPPSKKTVEAFVRAIENSALGESYIGEGTEICDGFLSLVYGEGVTNRLSCRDVYIIDRTASGFEMHWAGGGIDSGSDLSDDIADLNHDGKLEFVLGTSIGSIPQRCTVGWPVVYAWTGANYMDVSEQFKGFIDEDWNKSAGSFPRFRMFAETTDIA